MTTSPVILMNISRLFRYMYSKMIKLWHIINWTKYNNFFMLNWGWRILMMNWRHYILWIRFNVLVRIINSYWRNLLLSLPNIIVSRRYFLNHRDPLGKVGMKLRYYNGRLSLDRLERVSCKLLIFKLIRKRLGLTMQVWAR